MAKRITAGILTAVMLLGSFGPTVIMNSNAQDTSADEPHAHSFACYEEYWLGCDQQDPDHNHSIDCYHYSGELACGLEEGSYHSHNEDDCECELAARILICDVPEHIHDESCIDYVIDGDKGDGKQEDAAPDETAAGEEKNGEKEESDKNGEKEEPDGNGEQVDVDASIGSEQEDAKNTDNEDAANQESTDSNDDAQSDAGEIDNSSLTDNSESAENQDDLADTVVSETEDNENGSDSDGQQADSNDYTKESSETDAAVADNSNDETDEESALAELYDDEALSFEHIYICGQTAHSHTASCYQEIWKCRKAPAIALQSVSVGFTAAVKNDVVATKDSDRFVFTITQMGESEDVVMPANRTATVYGAGNAEFEEIGFTAPGSYTFEIATQNTNSNYRYDARTWTLTVTVAENNGELTAVGSYVQNSEAGETSGSTASFINVCTYVEGWSSDTIRQAQSIMSGMSLEEKVGQLFLFHYPEDGAGTAVAAKELIDKYHFGGYLVFAAMFSNATPNSVRQKIAETQAASDIPLLFTVDEEGGTVVRVSKYTAFRSTKFKSPQDLKAAGGLSAVRSDAMEKASLLTGLGLNVNHAPVADVSGPGGYIYARTWGGDGLKNAEFVEAVVEASEGAGLGTTMKHFPGYGGTSSNTHNGFAVNDLTMDDFLYNDLLPFQAGMAAGGNSVMVTHNTINAFDSENPSSLSPAIYSYLRNEMNFDGVAMTDDLNMGAITSFAGAGQASLKALMAGADMAMTNSTDDVDTVLAAAKNGALSMSAIEEKCRRILCWKIELGLIEEQDIDPASSSITAGAVVGNGCDPAGEEFVLTLSLLDHADDVIMPSNNQVTVTSENGAKFDEVKFKDAGTYHLKVSAVEKNNPRYVINAAWDITITVEYQSGKLVVTKTDYSGDSKVEDKTFALITTVTERVGPTSDGKAFVDKVGKIKLSSNPTLAELNTVQAQIAAAEADYASLSDYDKEQVQEAYQELCDLKELANSSLRMSSDAQKFIDMANELPAVESVTLDNLGELRTMMQAINDLYNGLSDSDKENVIVKDAKENIVDKLQAILDAEDNLSDAAKAFIDGVNAIQTPSYDAYDEQGLLDFINELTRLEDLYSSLSEEERQNPSVKAVIDEFEELKTIKIVYTQASIFVKAVDRIDLDTELTIDNYADFVAAYEDARDKLTNKIKKYPFVQELIPILDAAAAIIDMEENLSDEAFAYISRTKGIVIPVPMTQNILDWLKNEISQIDALYENLSEGDLERILVKEAILKRDILQNAVDKEEDLPTRALAFVVSVDQILYSIPFSNTSFETFKAQIDEAYTVYSRLTSQERNLVKIRDAESRLEALEAVRDRELNLNAAASAFVDAVNSIRMPNPPEHTVDDTKAQIEEASNLYNNLSAENLNRLLVINAKSTLNKLCVRLETIVGLSDTAQAFIDELEKITIPTAIDSEFLNSLRQQFPTINELYGHLTSEDKEWFSVQEAMRKMSVLIDLLGERKGVHYDIQYYAYVNQLSSYGDVAFSILDTTGGRLPRNGVSDWTKFYMYLVDDVENRIGASGKVKTETKLTQIYDSNNFDLVSEYDISRVDKLRGKDGYKLSEIWVLKDGSDPASINRNDWVITNDVESFTLNPEVDAESTDRTVADSLNNWVVTYDNSDSGLGDFDITPSKNVILRLVYDENTNKKELPVKFYDYDISNGTITGSKTLDTAASGINSNGNYPSGTGTKLSFGNVNTGVTNGSATWVDSNGITNTPNRANNLNNNKNKNLFLCTFGLAKRLVNGKIQYASGLRVPNLFDDGFAVGKTPYENGEFSLEFSRFGDTYTLQSVKKGGTPIINNLDSFEAVCPTWNNTGYIWSNNFWPMDYADSAGTAGHDPLFGETKGMYTGSNNASFPASDDSLDHNSYFGMQFSVDFTVPADYIGPLEYYFYGDDDLWVFLDDQLVCDIGGVHSSVGEYADLWDYVERSVESDHTLTVYYTERGASGSSCYMRYTLPSVTVASDVSEFTPARFTPKVTKAVEGTDDKDSFEFEIKNIGRTDGVIMSNNRFCTTKGSGTGIFDMLSFTKSGTYQFEITEVDGHLPGYVYDDDAWTLTIEVGASGKALVTTSVAYTNSSGTITSTNSAQFWNKYSWNEAFFTPTVTKVITDAALIQAGREATFQFTIIPLSFYENVKYPETMTVSIDGEGTADFGQLRFLEEGTYEFMILEEDGSSKYYSYDKSVWRLTVEVVSDGVELTATGIYDKEDRVDANTESAIFVNTYKTGKLLPNAGSIGTVSLYVASIGIIALGIAMVFVKKKSQSVGKRIAK